MDLKTDTKIKYKYEYNELATKLRKRMNEEFYWTRHCYGFDSSLVTPAENFLLSLYCRFDSEIMVVKNKNTNEQHKLLQEYKDSIIRRNRYDGVTK